MLAEPRASFYWTPHPERATNGDIRPFHTHKAHDCTVKMVAGASLAPSILRASQAAETAGLAAKVYLESLDYQGVRLLDGMLKTQYDRTREYYLKIPNDDILKGFRQRAGLPAPGQDIGGWAQVKLGASDVQWFLKAAKQLRPLGDPVDVHKPPLCFQSGSGSYCSDRYAQAKVDQYLRGSLKSVTIAYKQSLHGTVSDRQAFPSNEHRIKVGQRWYAIDQKLVNDAVIGSTVNLTTFGCGVESIDCEAIGNKANPQK
jgi:hypothetical protein